MSLKQAINDLGKQALGAKLFRMLLLSATLGLGNHTSQMDCLVIQIPIEDIFKLQVNPNHAQEMWKGVLLK